jgi:hypothetical protein
LLAKRRALFEPCDVKLHGKSLLVLDNSEDDSFCTLSVFNSNLELIGSFGQGDPQLPFYFASDKKHGICISVSYFIVSEDREWEDEEGEQKIKIINRERLLYSMNNWMDYEEEFLIFEILFLLNFFYFNKI